jgi:uncharacterized protein YgbK (DUF1537 family)
LAECVVVADDLTGANATGVLLTKMNYRATTVMNLDTVSPSTLSDCDCILYPTDSRGTDAKSAYDAVYEATSRLKGDGVKIYSKRIDSTLRGNLGSETDAMLDCLGDDYLAIVAPCFPSSGRIVIGGFMLVNGLPLHKTNIALDPKTPVKTSDAAALFRKQSKYRVTSVRLNEMMGSKEDLANQILTCKRMGYRTIIFDCITQEDLDLIADACIISGIRFIAVDPGVFTATLSRKMIAPRSGKEENRILVVVGSVNSNTTAQMEELWLSQKTHNVFVNTKELLEEEKRRQFEVDRVVTEILAQANRYSVSTVTGDGIYPENRIDFRPYMERYNCTMDDVTGRINDSLAEITEKIIRSDPAFRGLYASGGDVTQAICKRFGAMGLDLRDEVLPLAAYGQFHDGEFDGLHLITKGGSQGGKDAINTCITYLKEKLYI